MKPEDLSQLSMIELFKLEAETQNAVLTGALLELERNGAGAKSFEVLMRAAHSVKGAARIVSLRSAELLAHGMEDCFVAAHQGQIQLQQPQIDHLLRAVDLLTQLARNAEPDSNQWETEHAREIRASLQALEDLARGIPVIPPPTSSETEVIRRIRAAPRTELAPRAASGPEETAEARISAMRRSEGAERVVRLGTDNLNRLLGLAGESLVESRWLGPFADSLQRLKRAQMQVAEKIDQLRRSVEEEDLTARTRSYFNDLHRQLTESRDFLAERLQDLDLYERRSSQLSQRLYLEVLRTRMRPFSDGVRRFPRMVRDLARSLGKQVRLEVYGETTQVDRDILERLETPLAHLLRNAIDHGCEIAAERRRQGKPEECLLRLEARHSAGVLLVSVSDDGVGVDPEKIRAAVTCHGLVTEIRSRRLTEAELLEYLFVPGFSLKETVTELSGRGFGLDVVQNMVKSVRGTVRVSNQIGRGFRIQLQLPLTLSVLRALLVEIAGEPYAFPLSQIARTLMLPRAAVEKLEGRHHFQLAGQQVGLLTAHEVLECGSLRLTGADLPVVLVGERNALYGVVVDRFLGERELVVQPLDARLGRVKNISSAALMDDGSPVLILEVDELVRSIEKLAITGQLAGIERAGLDQPPRPPKRILAVDDSAAVRELESKLLSAQGFLVDQVSDGAQAWAALQQRDYQLVITDVDMPRMSGIELTAQIRRDDRFQRLPVLIISYKDSEADRIRGLEAGADYYLTKGTFQEETLVSVVRELIGEPE